MINGQLKLIIGVRLLAGFGEQVADLADGQFAKIFFIF